MKPPPCKYMPNLPPPVLLSLIHTFYASFTTITSTITITQAFCPVTVISKRGGLASLIAYPKAAISSACNRLSLKPTATLFTTKIGPPTVCLVLVA